MWGSEYYNLKYKACEVDTMLRMIEKRTMIPHYQPSHLPNFRNSTRVHLLPPSLTSSLSLSESLSFPLSREDVDCPYAELWLETLTCVADPRGRDSGYELGEPVSRGKVDILGAAIDDEEFVDGDGAVDAECDVGEGNASRYHPPEYVNATS